MGRLVPLQLADFMNFQCARNLNAINRALQTVADALLHIGDRTDCRNREVILAVSDSVEAELLLEAAGTDLLRTQTILNQHLLAVERRFRTAQVAYLLERPVRRRSETDSSAQEPMEHGQHLSDEQSNDTQKGLPEDGHSYEATIVKSGLGNMRLPRERIIAFSSRLHCAFCRRVCVCACFFFAPLFFWLLALHDMSPVA